MSVETDKLERFSNAVYKEVNEKVSEILAEAESSRQEMIKRVSDKSLDISYDVMQDEIKKINQKYIKLVAKAELDAKKEVLIHREELTKLVFAGVQAKVNEFAQSDSYYTFLDNKFKEAMADVSADEEVVVYMSEKDMSYADSLKKLTSVKNIEFKADTAIKFGGLSILYKKCNIVNDKTLDLAISAKRDEFNLNAMFKID